MSRTQIAGHYARILARWPTDVLRPERKFETLLRARSQQPPTPSRPEEREVNAAYLLLDNTFTKQYPVMEKLMRPASKPDHYADLERDLEAAPNMGLWDRIRRRLGGMVRFK